MDLCDAFAFETGVLPELFHGCRLLDGNLIGHDRRRTSGVTKRHGWRARLNTSSFPHSSGLPKVSAPFGVVGRLAEHFFLPGYFIKFLQTRNAVIRRAAECSTEEWRHSLS
jgi:hypothetical protein